MQNTHGSILKRDFGDWACAAEVTAGVVAADTDGVGVVVK